MKTSASKTQQIDRYLLKQMPPDDRLVFDARIILCPELDDTVQWQGKVHELVKLRGRKALKEEIQAIEEKLFDRPQYSGFKQRIMRLFGR